MEKPLHIPPTVKLKGFTVYCRKCNTDIGDTCRETGKPIRQCPFGGRHVFKKYVYVPRAKNVRKTKTFETRDLKEAIKEALDFESKVKAGNGQPEIKIENRKENIQVGEKNVPHLLINAIARYSAWLRNENVPEHLHEERSKEYVEDIERKLKLLVESLKDKEYDLASFRVDQINDATVGHVFSYLKKKRKFSARTFNKHFSYYTSFLKWFSEEYYPIRSWFTRVEKMRPVSKPQAITKEEVEALLERITPENGIETYDTGVKEVRNFYRPYLKNAFRLALLTGTRREELIKMKFNGIHKDKDGKGYITVEDFKINKIQKRTTEEDKKYRTVFLTRELCELLDGMDYQEMRGTDNYILAPEVKSNRGKPMTDLISRAFTHYYKQLNTGRKLTFRSFRKTYITRLAIYMREVDIEKYTGHSNKRTIQEYYTDPEMLAKSMWNFEIFSDDLERKNEIKQVRNKSRIAQKGLEVEQ